MNTCKGPECTRVVFRHGLCRTHNDQMRLKKTLTPIRHYQRQVGLTCGVADCNDKAFSRGACNRHYQLMLKYKLSIEEVTDLTNRVCQVCGSSENLHIDHDHECCPGAITCGQCVRGVLCGHCNRGIGFFRNDSDLLVRAADYMAQKPMKSR